MSSKLARDSTTYASLIVPAFYEERAGKLGPDPLRDDADPERLWQRMIKSRKPVGLFLMDQEAVAGIGNIYRAEILFKVGVLIKVC